MISPPTIRLALLRVAVGLLLIGTLSGCSGALLPLYRDYVAPDEASDLRDRIETALHDAGWTERESSAPNVVTTESRPITNWGLYRVEVWLDVTPVNDQYVRVLFHPFRYYVTGNRSKISYLNRRLRNTLLPELNEAFAAQGLRLVGTPIERDEEMTGQ